MASHMILSSVSLFYLNAEQRFKQNLQFCEFLYMYTIASFLRIRSVPGNKDFPVNISAMIHPTDQMSTENQSVTN